MVVRAGERLPPLVRPAYFVYYLFMAKSIGVIPKQRGRPPTGKDPMVAFRSPPELTARVDAWATEQPGPKPSRSEALRLLVEKGLVEVKVDQREFSHQSDASLNRQIAERKAAIAEMPEHTERSPEAGMAAMDKAVAENDLIDMKNKRTRRKNAKRG
jgi:hypothetical protein